MTLALAKTNDYDLDFTTEAAPAAAAALAEAAAAAADTVAVAQWLTKTGKTKIAIGEIAGAFKPRKLQISDASSRAVNQWNSGNYSDILAGLAACLPAPKFEACVNVAALASVDTSVNFGEGRALAAQNVERMTGKTRLNKVQAVALATALAKALPINKKGFRTALHQAQFDTVMLCIPELTV
jgi:hypothetical protein